MSRITAAVMVGLVSALSLAAAHAATPTVAPAATGTAAATAASPTAEPAAVAAPTNLRIDLASRQISWQDNSSDETGFQIVYSVEGATTVSATYTVGANVTSFEIPATAPAFSCGHTLKVSVAALKGSIASAPAQNGLSSICPPPSTGTGAPASNLPSTGMAGAARGGRTPIAVALGALLIAGVAAITLGQSIQRRLS